jgi:predicted XRE-type DNA-binding protein
VANNTEANDLRDEMIAIKKLIILALMRGGASQAQIASALGVDQSRVSRLFPGGLKVQARKAK